MSYESKPKVLITERLLSDEIINHHELQKSESTSYHKTAKSKSDIKDKIKNRQSPGAMKLTKSKKILIFVFAWIAIIFGAVLGIFWTKIFDKILVNQLILSPSSQSYSLWKETPIPMYLKIYLFNWTNPKEFIKNNAKPHFEELGPYVFREVDYKVNPVWNDNGTITFNQKRVWHFDKSQSNGSLSDTITNLNPVAVSIGYKVRHKKLLALAVHYLLKNLNETLTVTKTAGEILFDGYEDNVLKVARALNITVGLPGDKFGWFYGRNGSETYDGVFNMLTGSKNLDNIGILQEWDHKKKSDLYPGKCNAINGTLGDLLPPPADSDTISIFAPDMCTLIHLKYNNNIDYGGLSGKRFISTAEMFDNGTKVQSRACYCDGVECQPSGTLNVSICKYGAPAFMSLPHFYLADESYRNSIVGMKPDKAKHEFSLAVQTDFGLPLQVQGRLQLNLLLQPIERIGIFANISKVYVPILWFTQEANLTSKYTNQIKFVLILPLLGQVTLYGIAGIGALVFFIGICLLIRERRKTDDIQNLISGNEDNTAVITSQ
ncbi:hypothetical protein PV326_013016 [Microctonus aethiopoides]|nr:hypothetical protein PV326_013016 [Microctonus aethiopoides]